MHKYIYITLVVLYLLPNIIVVVPYPYCIDTSQLPSNFISNIIAPYIHYYI